MSQCKKPSFDIELHPDDYIIIRVTWRTCRNKVTMIKYKIDIKMEGLCYTKMQ